jgi:hypothetical protein
LLASLTFPAESIAVIRLLPDARALALALVARTGERDMAAATLRLVPTDLRAAGEPIPLCQEAVLGLAHYGVRDRIYAVCRGDEIVEVDRELAVRVRSVRLTRDSTTGASCGVSDIGTSPNGTLIYVLCANSGTLLYLDRVQLTPFDSVAVGPGGRRFDRTPDGHFGIVTRPAVGQVIIVDLRGRASVSQIALEGAREIGIGSDGRTAFIAATTPTTGRLVRVNLTDGRIVAAVAIPPGDPHVTVWPSYKSPRMRWTR